MEDNFKSYDTHTFNPFHATKGISRSRRPVNPCNFDIYQCY